MYSLEYTGQFKKDLKRIYKQGLNIELLRNVLRQLGDFGQVDSKHFPHPLTGNWRGFWECHISPDWLLIYSIEKTVKVVRLVRTGSHSELFSKKKP